MVNNILHGNTIEIINTIQGYFVFLNDNSNLNIYNISKDHNELFNKIENIGEIKAVSISYNLSKLIVVKKDSIVEVFDFVDFEFVKKEPDINTYGGNIVTCCLSVDGTFCYLSAKNTVQVWNLDDFKKIITKETNGFVNKLKNKDDTILIGTELGYIYHLKNQNKLINVKKNIHGCVNDIDINAYNIFITGDTENLVTLWDNENVKKFEGHYSSIVDVKISENKIFIISKDIDNELILWKIENRLEYYHIPIKADSFIFSEDNENIIFLKNKDNNCELNLLKINNIINENNLHKYTKWDHDNAIMIGIAGGAGYQDASLTKDGLDSRTENGEVIENTGGKDGMGGKGWSGQGGTGGAGWLGSGIRFDSGLEDEEGGRKLSDITKGFKGGYRKSENNLVYGGLGGGGVAWYSSGGGGGYSGGGGAQCYGKSGGGGTFVTDGIEGINEYKEREVKNTDNGYVILKSKSGNITFNGEYNGIRVSKKNNQIEPNGIQIYEILKQDKYYLEIAGAAGFKDGGKGAVIYLSIENLDEGDLIGIMPGQRGGTHIGNYQLDSGGGATIVWLIRNKEKMFIASLAPERADLALKFIEKDNFINMINKENVVNALLIQNSDDEETKWSKLVCCSNENSNKLVEYLINLEPKLKEKMLDNDVILSSLKPYRVESSIKLLNKLDTINNELIKEIKSKKILNTLIKDTRSHILIEKLIEKDNSGQIGELSLLESIQIKNIDYALKLIENNIKLTEDYDLRKDLKYFIEKDYKSTNDNTFKLIKHIMSFNPLELSDFIIQVYLKNFSKGNKFDRIVELLKDFNDVIDFENLSEFLCKKFVDKALLYANPEFMGSSIMHEISKNELAYKLVYELVLRDKQLAVFEDKNDRTVYDVACKDVKNIIDSIIQFCGRFKITSIKPEHKSATSIVLRSIDIFNDNKNVIIKLMKNKDQYLKEVNIRENLGDTNDIVNILFHSESPELINIWKEDVKNKLNYEEYIYGIIMDAGDRNLQTIYQHERPTINEIRVYTEQIFKGVSYLHDKDIMHGDIKTLNIIRFIVDNHLHIIDLDAASSTLEESQTEDGIVDYVGSKFSSVCLPPELIYKFKNDEEEELYNEYWKEEKDNNTELWKKISPKKHKYGSFVIKTFRYESENNRIPYKINSLPYDLVEASKSVDVWSLGILLYKLCTDKELVAITRDNDYVSGGGFNYIYTWDDKIAKIKLRDIEDPLARNLISKLLIKDPTKRATVKDLLNNDPFFKNQNNSINSNELLENINEIKRTLEETNKSLARIEKRTINIEELNLSIKGELSQGVEELKRRILSVSSSQIPTFFVICPELSELDKMKNGADEILKAINDKDHQKILTYTNLLLDKSRNLYENITSTISNPSKVFKDALGNENYNIYLLCEICYEKQESNVWPIPVSKTNSEIHEVVSKILPLAKSCLQVVKLINGVSKIGRLFGYPLPKLPVNDKSLDFLEDETSVSEFHILENKLLEESDNEEENSKVEGYSQREFKRFLNKYDKKEEWANLSCITLDEGTSIWCCEKCHKILKDNPKSTIKNLKSLIKDQDDDTNEIVKSNKKSKKSICCII